MCRLSLSLSGGMGCAAWSKLLRGSKTAVDKRNQVRKSMEGRGRVREEKATMRRRVADWRREPILKPSCPDRIGTRLLGGSRSRERRERKQLGRMWSEGDDRAPSAALQQIAATKGASVLGRKGRREEPGKKKGEGAVRKDDARGKSEPVRPRRRQVQLFLCQIVE